MTSTSDYIGPDQSDEDIKRRFTYHEPSDIAISRMSDIRNYCELLANLIRIEVPDGREKSLAITKVEEAMFWANAGIVRGSSMQEGIGYE